jgi:hypothetical protein
VVFDCLDTEDQLLSGLAVGPPGGNHASYGQFRRGERGPGTGLPPKRGATAGGQLTVAPLQIGASIELREPCPGRLELGGGGSSLANQGLAVTERYVKQILDQRRPAPRSRRRGSGPRSPRR